MLRCYEPAHIVGVSKTAYVPATPRSLAMGACLTDNQHAGRPAGSGFAGAVSPSCWSPSRRSPPPSASSCRRPRPRRRPPPRRRPRRPTEVRRGKQRWSASARLTAPSPTARRSSTTRSRSVADLDPELLGALRRAATRGRGRRGRVLRRPAAGVLRSTRNSCSVRRSRSTAQKRKPPAGWPRPTRRRTCRGTRSTSGPSDAAAWLSAHGAEYGLCQIYGNEPWHYELRPEAADQGCPPVYADPTHDPRMQS